MAKLKYALLTEVSGRGLADVIESFLKSEDIEVVLVQEAISHLTHPTSFALVQIYVPRESLRRARALLKTLKETQIESKENPGMANKNKMAQRAEAERRARQARNLQIAGGVVIVLVIAAVAWMVFPKSKSQTQTGSIGDQTACVPFSDIPVAAQYTQPPMKIDTTKQYFATVKMAKGGEFVIQLLPDKAPVTVNSFVFLACKGFFNGITFHRVLEGFMAQGGDPTGTGTGGPGYEFQNEDNDLTFDKAGIVAMANHGRDTNGSQFFITFDAAAHLNGGYTIFGQVVSGMDVVNGITRRDPDTNPTSPGDAMESVTITEK